MNIRDQKFVDVLCDVATIQPTEDEIAAIAARHGATKDLIRGMCDVLRQEDRVTAGRVSRKRQGLILVDVLEQIQDGGHLAMDAREVAKVHGASEEYVRGVFSRLQAFADCRPRAEDSGKLEAKAPFGFYWQQVGLRSHLKEALAGTFAECIKREGSTEIACGAGSTVAHAIAATIQRTCLTVFTNSAALFDVYRDYGRVKGSLLRVSPGAYHQSIEAIVGSDAASWFTEHGYESCVIGVSGITEAGDLTVTHDVETSTLKSMLEKDGLRSVYVVADITKFARNVGYKFSSLKTLAGRAETVKIVTNPMSDLPDRDRHRRRAIEKVRSTFSGFVAECPSAGRNT